MGILSDIGDAVEKVTENIADRMSPGTILTEMGAGFDKMVSQGAAEVGQALFAGNAYMPYGPTQAPIDMAGDAPASSAATEPVQAAESNPAVQEASVEPTIASEPSQSYQQMLDSYAPPSPPMVEKSVEMER